MHSIAVISKKIIFIGFALLFILVPLILTPWNYELFEYNKMMMTYGLTAIIIGAWLVNMVVTGNIRIRKTPLDIPIILFVLSQFISTLFSMDPHVSWFGYYSRFNGGMISVISYVALYYAFVSNISIDRLRITNNELFKNKSATGYPLSTNSIVIRLLQIILITGLIVALYGVAEHFGIDKDIWVQDVQNRVFSTLGQPNWLAAYLIALCPIAWGFALWKIEDRKSKVVIENRSLKIDKKNFLFSIFYPQPLSSMLYVLLSIVFFLTLLWTRSRSGFFALLIADIVFWGIVCFQTWKGKHKKRISLKDPFVRPFLFIHSVFIVIIMLNGVYVKQIDDWVTISAWKNRISAISHQSSAFRQSSTPPASLTASTSSQLIETGVTDSGDIRKYVWEGAVNVWNSSLKARLIGTGTETFAFSFYQYKPVGHNLTSEWDFLYNKAHNEYLNFLATTGILGLGTYVLLIVSFIIWSLKFLIFNFQFSIKISNFKFQIIKNNNSETIIPPTSYLISLGLFAGWISILITNFFGFSVVIMQLFFYLFPAYIIVLSQEHAVTWHMRHLDWPIQKKKIIISSITGITALMLGILIVSWFSDKYFASGYHLSRSGFIRQAYEKLSVATKLNPTEPIFRDEQATVLAGLALAAWNENEATVSQELASTSIQENAAALAISPMNVNFWKTKTKILYALSSIDPSYLNQAIIALEKATLLSPQDPKMYYNLSILYGQSGQLEKAIELMEKTIQLKPNYREGYMGLSILYTQSGQTEQSRQAIEEYLTKVDPNDEEFQKLIQ